MRTLTFSLLLVLIFSCKKDDSLTLKKTNKITIEISGITSRDNQGIITNSIDSTDWVADSTWPEIVNSQFNFSDTINYDWNNDSSDLYDVMAYSNPLSKTDESFVFSFISSKSAIMKYIIIDESVTVYQSGSMRIYPGGTDWGIPMPNTIFSSNRYYRIYYALINKFNNIYYRGHGDLIKN